MRKLLNLLVVLAVIFCASSAFADVGCYDNGSYNASTNMFTGLTHCGPTTDINWISQVGSAANTQVGMVRSVPALDQNLFATGVGNGGAISVPSTTAAVPVGYAYVRKVIPSNGDALFTAGTLANGYPGEVLTIYGVGLSPSGATTGGNYTITPTLSTGFTSVEMTAVNDEVTLIFIDTTVGWVLGPHSGTLTIVLKN